MRAVSRTRSLTNRPGRWEDVAPVLLLEGTRMRRPYEPQDVEDLGRWERAVRHYEDDQDQDDNDEPEEEDGDRDHDQDGDPDDREDDGRDRVA
jgi:hypothetical protein